MSEKLQIFPELAKPTPASGDRQPVKNVIDALAQIPPAVHGKVVTNCAFATPRTEYWYYNCSADNVVDSGWGCGYRCLQMAVSAIPNCDGETKIPTIRQIQAELAALGQHAKSATLEGSDTWIEPPDCAVRARCCVAKSTPLLPPPSQCTLSRLDWTHTRKLSNSSTVSTSR